MEKHDEATSVVFIYKNLWPSSHVRNGKSLEKQAKETFNIVLLHWALDQRALPLGGLSWWPGAFVRSTTFWISIPYFTVAWVRMLHQAKLRTGRPLLQLPISYCSHSAPGTKRFICFSYFQQPINLIVIISCHWSCLEEEMLGERDWGGGVISAAACPVFGTNVKFAGKDHRRV